MRLVTVHGKTGEDGVLHLDVPLGEKNAEFEVLVVVQPAAVPAPTTPPEERGWPPGYFGEETRIDDETFVRHPQGEYEKRLDFE